MTSGANPISAAPAAEASSTSGSTTSRPKDLGADPLAQKETFLRLLVAQIKNQNPLKPADGIEFLSQLAQFSQLEQMIEIRSELETISRHLTKPADAGPAAATPDPGKGA